MSTYTKDCKKEKITVIEHDNLKYSTQSAYYAGCTGQFEREFTAETGYYCNPLYGKHDHHRVGFTTGSYVKTGDSNELVEGYETELPSGGNYNYLCTIQFHFTHKHDEQPYQTEDSIIAQGTEFYDDNVNGGELSIPNKWAIIGGTGKYRHATGEVKVTDLGCQPVSEGSEQLVAKYKYKIYVRTRKC